MPSAVRALAVINCGSLATVSEELALVVQLASVNNSSVSPVVTPATLICGVVSLLGDELGSFNVNPLGALGAEVSTIRVTTLPVSYTHLTLPTIAGV